MSATNLKNRTIFCRDNVDILRGINSDSIDLIYLDPPFNKKKEFTAPIGSSAEGATFKDTFIEEDIKDEWVQEIKEDYEGLYNFLSGVKTLSNITSSRSNKHYLYNYCYLAYLAIRLVEMQRILKETGSIYLHCDSTMSHYIKILMDVIFGEKNFRNEIIWRRATSHNDGGKYGNITDTIFFYTKTSNFVWNGKLIATPKSAEQLREAYPSKDTRGDFRSDNLTGPGGYYRSADLTGPLHGAPKGSPSTSPWRDYDVYSMGRCWSVPKTGDYARYIDENLIPGYSQIEGIHERLDALDKAGLIYHPKKGKWPGLKRYADADQGIPLQNLILDPIGFTNYNKGVEYVGYPTQKPLALLERIIQASSNEGNIVLDPFCGCATTCVASEKLNRQWIGIDVSHLAFDLVRERLQKEVADPENLLQYQNEIYYSTTPPKRTDTNGDTGLLKKYVYVISNSSFEGDEYKVGIAIDVKKRLNSYQTNDPNRSYKIEHTKLTPYFREIENQVHTKFDNRHEWVRAKLEDIIKEIEEFDVDKYNKLKGNLF